ncbi:MAG TPA: hypothetical protein VIL72_14890 [Beijerinckiaceae bacterium]|jgi:hypothetical protein
MSLTKTAFAALLLTGALAVGANAQVRNENTLDSKVPLNTQAGDGVRANPGPADRADQFKQSQQNRTLDSQVPLNTQATDGRPANPGPADRADMNKQREQNRTLDSQVPLNTQAPTGSVPAR